VTEKQVEMIRYELEQKVPYDDAARRHALDALTRLRETGAITESDYQAERDRLRAKPAPPQA
jgi:hypothetical protein